MVLAVRADLIFGTQPKARTDTAIVKTDYGCGLKMSRFFLPIEELSIGDPVQK
jgi:hypothetical protein